VIALAVLAALLTGGSLLALFRFRCRTWPGLAGAAFFLGVMGLALWTHALLLVRVPVNAGTVAAGPLALAAAALRWGDRSALQAAWTGFHPGALFVILAALFAVAGALAWSYLGPDGETFYAFKALSIVHYGTFWNPDFTDPAPLHVATRRPLLLSSIYADLFLLARTSDLRLVRLWFALLFAASLGLFHERAGLSPWWLAVLAWMPAWWRDIGGVFTGFADAPLGALFLLGYDALRKGERALAVFALSAAVLLKQDAWAFLPALAAATAIAQRRELGPTCRAIAVPAAVAVVWIVLSRFLPWTPDFEPDQFSPARLLSSPARWPLVVERSISELAKPKHWGFFWAAFAGGTLLSARSLTREDARWLLVVAAQAAAYGLVWATYPAETLVHHMRVQQMRLLFHVAPLAWMWLGLKGAASTVRRTP
jgi:hypothetical protein